MWLNKTVSCMCTTLKISQDQCLTIIRKVVAALLEVLLKALQTPKVLRRQIPPAAPPPKKKNKMVLLRARTPLKRDIESILY
jgi:hypothetical protein